jgi:hypothetical protein
VTGRPSYTVLVNSCDSFADCWEPFFTLLGRYWPDCPAPVVLNTEYMEYQHPGVEIVATAAARSLGTERRPTWSEVTKACLDRIETDVVLYLQDDYFLHAPVREDLIDRFTSVLLETDATSLRLFETHLSGPWRATENDDVWQVLPSSEYLISLQAGLWRTDRLRAHLRPHETAWEFEVLGSKRVRRAGDLILCVDRDRFTAVEDRVIPYGVTGINKGKWVREHVIPLFADHGIEVDFSVRGFFGESPPPHRSFRVKVRDRLKRVIRAVRSRR